MTANEENEIFEGEVESLQEADERFQANFNRIMENTKRAADSMSLQSDKSNKSDAK